ncbi:MAG: hypothetical protein LC803_08935 [Acidobacteria bacterium]|nr:hypothetical protein [Acidobacteriota bacterium]
MSISIKSGSAAIGFSIFLTAYDPLDLASNSIDVLGFQRGYIALADKILPGFTTITTSPRYVPMLCAAIRMAQDKYSDSTATPVRIRQQRLDAIKSYERAWALACGLAASEAQLGVSAVDGLRGVQSVRRRLSELSGREKYIRTNSLNLLANQVRYGGIGAYSTFMEDCHLASMRSLSLRPLGAALADAFPEPAGALAVHDEEQPLSLEELKNWGRRSHLSAISREEAANLKRALRGGEEGGWEDDVRWSMLRLLAATAKREDAESVLLKKILSGIQSKRFEYLKLPAECLQQLRAALVIIHPYEILYQSLQFLFDAVRAAATDATETTEASLKAVGKQSNVLRAYAAAKSASEELLSSLDEASAIHRKTAEEIRTVLMDTGIAALLTKIKATPSAPDLLSLVLDRHLDVQQGKFDKGGRKAPWVKRETSEDRVHLTALRHRLIVSDRKSSWDDVPRHPYRTFGALRFIEQCVIR